MFSTLSNVLNSIDNAAKESLEEHGEESLSATEIRSGRKKIITEAESNIETTDSAATGISNRVLDADIDLILKTKDKEIERLNRECLDLEETCSHLKKEVQEAWESFKVAQEKSAIKEMELQEEVRQISKAKQTDKAQFTTQMATSSAMIDELNEKIIAISSEKESILADYRLKESGYASWLSEEKSLLASLEEAKANASTHVHTLRDELKSAHSTIEILRSEQSGLLRQSHVAQSVLEESNARLVSELSSKQKEVLRLTKVVEDLGGDDIRLRELDNLREMTKVLKQSEEDRIKEVLDLDKRLREALFELRSLKLSSHEESTRHMSMITELTNRNTLLEKTIHDMSEKNRGGVLELEGDDGSIIAGLDAQVASLGQQLLKKETSLLELQAERAALKSKLQDMTQRCSTAEKRLLSSSKDIEGGMVDEDYEDEDEMVAESQAAYPQKNGRLINRNRRIGDSNEEGTTKRGKLLTDDIYAHIGVRANPTVTKAVNTIDAWMLLTGRFLRNYPMLRLAFIIYLLMLHIWALVILAIHLHSIEIDESMGNAIIAGGGKLT